MAISAGDVLVKINGDSSGLNRSLDQVDGKIKKSTGQWQQRMKKVGMVMVGAAVAVGGASIKMAADFDTAMREVNTMMLLNEEEFAEFSKEVRTLSKEMGVNAVESAEALYQAISAGVPKENVLTFMEVATKAAIGGVTSTETAVDGLTTVINAFKMDINDAQKVADIMFTTVKGGKTTFEELSASMSLAAPIAASLGVEFEDVMAAVATLTKQGTPTAMAFTQIKGAMVALMKPTDEMKDLMNKAGYETGEAMFQALGFAGTLDALRTAANNNNEVLAKAFGRVEALNAVLGVTGENAEMAAADIDSMTEAAGSATDAFEQMEKSTTRKFAKVKAQFQDTAITLGNALIPMVTRLLEAITPIIEKMADWIDKNPKLSATILVAVGAIGGLMVVAGPLMSMFTLMAKTIPIITAAMHSNTIAIVAHKVATVASSIATKIATAVQWLWNVALSANPIGLIILAIAGLILLIVYLTGHWDELKEKFWDAFHFMQEKLAAFIGFFTGIPEKIRAAFTRVKDFILAPFRAAAAVFENIINYFIRTLNKLSVKVPSWVPGMGGKTIGFNIPEVSLAKFAKGGMINEPTLLYGLKSQKPYAIAGEAGPERVSPSGSGGTSNINISQMVVREDADIYRVARELFRLQQSQSRQVGVG